MRRCGVLLLVLWLSLSLLPLPASAQDGGTATGGTAARITLSVDPQVVQPGGASTLSAVVQDVYGQPVPGVEVDFSATAGAVDPASAVTDDQGKVAAAFTAPQEQGEVTVTAQVYGTDLTASAAVTVQAPQQQPAGGQPQQPAAQQSDYVPPTLTGIAVQPDQAAMTVGGTVQLAVTARYSDGSTSDVTGQAGYASSDPSVAAVSASGLVTGVAPGAATVTATYQGQSAVASVTVQAQQEQPKQPEQPAPLQVVEITPAPGSEIDPFAEVRVKFDRPVVVARSELAAYNLNGCGVSYEWGEVDPADPTVVKLKKPCGFPAGQITLAGIPASSDPVVKGRDDGATLAENMPQLTYTVRAVEPKVTAFGPSGDVALGLLDAFGHQCLGNDRITTAIYADFDVPVEIADPGKIKLLVETPLYSRTLVAGTEWADGVNWLVARAGNRVTPAQNYTVSSVLGPAMRGRLTLVFEPGAVKHYGSSDAVNAVPVSFSFTVNSGSLAGEFSGPVLPGPVPVDPPKKALQNPTEVWRVPLPGPVNGLARAEGVVYASGGYGLTAVSEDGRKLWEVSGDFSAPRVGPDGGVYVTRLSKGEDGTIAGHLYLERYNADGTLAWRRFLVATGDCGGQADVRPAPPEIASTSNGDVLVPAAEGVFGMASGSGFVLFRYAPDGTLKAAYDLSSLLGGNAATGDGACKLALRGERAVVATGYNIAVVDLSGGQPVVLAKKPVEAAWNSTPAVYADESGFYAVENLGTAFTAYTCNARVTAFSPDGVERWSVVLPNAVKVGFMVSGGGKLYYGNYEIDAATGQFRELPRNGDYRMTVLAVCDDGTLVGNSNEGTVGFLAADGDLRECRVGISLQENAVLSFPVAFGSLYLVAGDLQGTYLVKLDEIQQPPAPVPVRLEVRPAEATVKVGEVQQYRAFVVYSDGTERDVTEECAWSVSDSSIASVGQGAQGGLAAGLKPGRVDVTATWEAR